MCEQEEWRDVVGYEGFYQVSNTGKVRSVDRFVNAPQGKRISRGKIISQINKDNGYLYVSLCSNGTRKNHYVHRLVADAFVNNAHCGDVVNHIDFNRKNNNAGNLEWCTQRYNVDYSRERMKKPRKKYKGTKTGYKYIQKRNDKYIVSISNSAYRIYKSFSTLEEAIEFRNSNVNGRWLNDGKVNHAK